MVAERFRASQSNSSSLSLENLGSNLARGYGNDRSESKNFFVAIQIAGPCANAYDIEPNDTVEPKHWY